MKDDRAYLLHIREAIGRVLSYSAAGREAFLADPKTQDAVIRNLEIIGEAAKSLSDTIRSSRPDVPWKQIAGMRDKLIHHYFGVNLILVWDTIATEIPRLRQAVDQMLA